MLSRYRQRHPGSSIFQLLFFDTCREASLLVLVLVYRLKRVDVRNIPATGPVLIVANHQSVLDPPVIAVGIRHRQADFLARGGLFKFKPFGWLISKLNASPIKQGAGDVGAMKATIAKLNSGKMMVVFPEGSRTSDGEMVEFQRGIAVLLKKSECQIVPAGIAGAFDAWPRTKKIPRVFIKRVVVCFGEPIDSKTLMSDGADDAIAALFGHVKELADQAQLHR